jgi:predicted RNase H-like nuclease (RuvC/YqgF family)
MVDVIISGSEPSSSVTRNMVQILVMLYVGRSPAARRADSSDSGDSSSGATTPTSNALVLSLMVQVKALQDSNKQLYQELRETKAELETLKHSWRQLAPEYEPGMLSGKL